MALMGQQAVTLADYASRLGPDSKIGKIIEMCSKSNPVLADALWLQANGLDHHKTVVRTGLPDSYWRKINRGVPRSKSQTVGVNDIMGMLEAWSVVDDDLVKVNAEPEQFLLSEEMAFVEGMQQKIARHIFYGDVEGANASFNGLSCRYDSYSDVEGTSSYNVINAGGTGTRLTSAWLLNWHDQRLAMIYPKGSTAGLVREHLGRKETLDDEGNEFMARKSHYQWKAGLTVRDYRSCVRIANIDTTELQALVDDGAVDAASQKLNRLFIVGRNRIPQSLPTGGKRYWYMTPTLKTMLEIIAMEKPNVSLYMKEFNGEEVLMLRGIPVHVADELLDTEEAVPAAA